MRIGVSREPPAQDVTYHARPAGPRITPRPHRGLVDHLIVGGQVEPFPVANVLDQ
jgi:hypothetical protein